MISSLTYLCHGNLSSSSVHPALKVNINCLTTAPCVSFTLSSGKKKEKGRKKIEEGWKLNPGVCFGVVVSTAYCHL